MPIWLRKFTYKKIANFVEQQNEAQKTSSQGSKSGNTRQIDLTAPPPDIKPGTHI